MNQVPPKLVMLVVLDGWGIAAGGPGNAISLTQTPNMNRFYASYPHSELGASGESVGLPRGEPGNTETGHLNLGAGRIVYQDLQRINMNIADGSFYRNQVLIGAIDHARVSGGNLHYMGLIGAGGVHSNIEHLYALIELAKKHEFNRVFLHLFTDGRDSPPTSAKTYVSEIRNVINKQEIGTIATIMGRYWAMDRDLRWDRTKKAYEALTKGVGNLVKTPEEAIEFSYSEGKTDEFIEPAIISGPDGKPVITVKENDSIVFFNFRIDRPRQLSSAFVFDDFSKANIPVGFDPYQAKYLKTHLPLPTSPVIKEPFARGPKLKNLYYVTMTEYGQAILEAGAKVAFPPETVDIPLGKVISDTGFRQLRACESEKERFVTFYFNGQKEDPFPGEDRLIIPSLKVSTYDLTPEMSARNVTDGVLKKLEAFPDYKFVLVNYANPDMVGHTGNIGAAAKTCQIVDECLGKLSQWILAYGGLMIITADHGNVEQMINDQTGEIETEHSGNPVPFIAVSNAFEGNSTVLPTGILADIAPTILKYLKIEIPTVMTGKNLLDNF